MRVFLCCILVLRQFPVKRSEKRHRHPVVRIQAHFRSGSTTFSNQLSCVLPELCLYVDEDAQKMPRNTHTLSVREQPSFQVASGSRVTLCVFFSLSFSDSLLFLSCFAIKLPFFPALLPLFQGPHRKAVKLKPPPSATKRGKVWVVGVKS